MTSAFLSFFKFVFDIIPFYPDRRPCRSPHRTTPIARDGFHPSNSCFFFVSTIPFFFYFLSFFGGMRCVGLQMPLFPCRRMTSHQAGESINHGA
jgi:hypothetical protein